MNVVSRSADLRMLLRWLMGKIPSQNNHNTHAFGSTMLAVPVKSMLCLLRPHCIVKTKFSRPNWRVMSTASRTTAAPKSVPPVPRPSASLVVVNGRNEILLVHRNPKASAFGGMHVFPGGNMDSQQDASLSMTAIRETFEESGLLLASPVPPAMVPSHEVLDESRLSIHQQKLKFQAFLDAYQLKADTNLLMPFTQWITPIGPPKRFHTQFYVTFLSSAPSSGFSSGSKEERLPTHDGGQEVIEARFVHPMTALDECREGKLNFMPPQYYILATLADILKGSKNTSDQRQKVEALSQGLFGRMVINPRKIGEDQTGRAILSYEGDEMRGGAPGRRHRMLVKLNGAASSELNMIRNFDIFTEIEEHCFSVPHKL